MRTSNGSPGAADEQAILALVELQDAELAGDIGQRHFDLRRLAADRRRR